MINSHILKKRVNYLWYKQNVWENNMGKVQMKQKKIISTLIIGIMLLSVVLTAAPTISAVPFHSVKGILYIDDIIADFDQALKASQKN